MCRTGTRSEIVNTGLLISLLNPAISFVFAATFFVFWLYQRQRRYLAGLAVAYAASATGFLLQSFTLPIGLAPTKFVSGVCFTIAVVLGATAVLARSGRKIPFLGFGVLAAGGLASFSFFLFLEPNLTWRIYALNFGFGAICLLLAAEMRAVRDKGPADWFIIALAVTSGVNFFVRTLLVIKFHGPFENYEGFYTSIYWTTLVMSHALLAMLSALCLIAAATLDIFNDLRSESRTDALSGLLNRRGFEDVAQVALERSRRHGLPLALVIADLDHFKAVNDTFGHSVGDRVIVGFAALLRTAAGRSGVAARLGGEEFAVLLPATNPVAARLFAEGVRTAFAAGGLNDVPASVRVTASFGVAFSSGSESLSDMLGRADEALYHAKKGGRDSVRLSYMRPSEIPFLKERAALP